MEIGQWLEKATHEHQRPLRLEWRAEIGEKSPTDKFRCQPRASVDFTGIEELTDARMPKLLEQPSLAPKDWGDR